MIRIGSFLITIPTTDKSGEFEISCKSYSYLKLSVKTRLRPETITLHLGRNSLVGNQPINEIFPQQTNEATTAPHLGLMKLYNYEYDRFSISVYQPPLL